ncbi:MAG: CPBP family intramembrane glutamic endopeptidase [Limnochordia bacterium]
MDVVHRRSTLLTLIGLAIAYSPSYISVGLRRAGISIGLQGPPSVLLWNWLAVGMLLLFVTKVEGRGLRSIGLKRPSRDDLRWAVYFWGISTTVSGLLNVVLPPAPNAGLATVVGLPLPVLIALIVTTSTTEEILFRSYPIERIRELTGSTWLAVAISMGLFVLPHIRFFGLVWLLYHGVGLVLFYVLYLWRRNLWACMLMHLLGNALLLLPATGIAG